MEIAADKILRFRQQGLDHSMAVAMAADELRREKIEREAKQAASRTLMQKARELANLPQLEDNDGNSDD